MSVTVYLSRDRENPQQYKCPNFEECGVSASHDPEYMGWPVLRTSTYQRACSEHCRRTIDIRRALA